MTGIYTRDAISITGQSPAAFRRWAARYQRRTGVDLHAPRETWPDERTPMWDETAIRAARSRNETKEPLL